MFYQEVHDNALRFGDVVQGYIKSSSKIENTISNLNDFKYKIDIELPQFSVILTPCCSIKENSITLAPLIKIRKNFFENTYFAEDLTRINRRIEPQNIMSSEKWDKLSYDEQQDRLKEGTSFAVPNLFIYELNNLFPQYPVKLSGETREINYYMIDFKDTYKINCDKITKPQNALVNSKCLQLSVKTRSELRDKLSSFYGRVPREDQCEL